VDTFFLVIIQIIKIVSLIIPCFDVGIRKRVKKEGREREREREHLDDW
jgi:hypothetical protein